MGVVVDCEFPVTPAIITLGIVNVKPVNKSHPGVPTITLEAAANPVFSVIGV
jgi:hypothetical protein